MRQEFGASQDVLAVDPVSTALAAQAKAMVEARHIMALRSPRSWDQVRQDLLKECRRPAFANNKSAYYRKPIGQGVEGLGIRFVEVALRCMRNVLVESTMILEDAMKEVHRVTVTDLESNVPWSQDVRVSRSVERSKPADDGSYLSVRKNSQGRDVYTVLANDDDLLNKRGALISKAVRTLGLRIIPGDLQDEAEDIIKAVRLDDAASDPDATRKKIVDAFGEIGVQANDLSAYLGHPIAQCSPAELVELRGLYGAIRDGEATWATAMENKKPNPGSEPTGDKKLPDYPEAKMQENLPKWRQAIIEGKKSADQIIATVASKHTLSAAQKKQISDLAAPPVASEQGGDPGASGVSYAKVLDQIERTNDPDILDVAADLIGEVADPAQRAELINAYRAKKAKLTGGGD